MLDLRGTPLDVLKITHHGELHGYATKIIHRSELYKTLSDLRNRDLKVVSVEKLGWVEDKPHE